MGLVLGDCRTLDAFNQMGGLPCIFPFTYNDKTYNECSNSGGTCSWCATKVDNSGAYIIGFWGCCNNVCPKEDQKGIYSIKNFGISVPSEILSRLYFVRSNFIKEGQKQAVECVNISDSQFT